MVNYIINIRINSHVHDECQSQNINTIVYCKQSTKWRNKKAIVLTTNIIVSITGHTVYSCRSMFNSSTTHIFSTFRLFLSKSESLAAHSPSSIFSLVILYSLCAVLQGSVCTECGAPNCLDQGVINVDILERLHICLRTVRNRQQVF